MPANVPPVRLRRHAQSNRDHILEAARRMLSVDPDVALEEIAEAAGVARRTLYGHFAGRSAVLEALAEEASALLAEALTAADHPAEPPEYALARFVLAIWPVADRYRMLLALASRDLGARGIQNVVEPARQHACAILARGQAAGVFHDILPAAVLNEALAALTFSLLECVNSGAWERSDADAAAAVLVAAGVTPRRAAAIAREVQAATATQGVPR